MVLPRNVFSYFFNFFVSNLNKVLKTTHDHLANIVPSPFFSCNVFILTNIVGIIFVFLTPSHSLQCLNIVQSKRTLNRYS